MGDHHDAYVDCLDGGYRGFQAACWSCKWRGPEHLRGDEEMGTDESRSHKRAARADAAEHRRVPLPGLRDDPCEYGCAGPCESLEHWRDRAEYLLEVGREWELRARYGTEAERRMRAALREIEDLPMGPADAPISAAQTIARGALDGRAVEGG